MRCPARASLAVIRTFASPGVDGQKDLRLQFNCRLSTLVYHSAHGISDIPGNIRRIFPADRLSLAGRQSTPGLEPLRFITAPIARRGEARRDHVCECVPHTLVYACVVALGF
eukprot:1192194-Prorocentrum_minimum.AAC.2